MMSCSSFESWLTTAIAREIEAILPTYPRDPYQLLFADGDIKQELIEYVLKQLPEGRSTERTPVGKGSPNRQTADEKIDQVRVLVHLGLTDVLREYTARSRVIAIDDYLYNNEPSHWFG